MFRTTVILCTIAAQVLAAPKPDGCIESCSTYSSHQTHEALIQQQTAALNELRQVAGSKLGSLDYARPGNWTEANEYRTDGGRGRVYEEQGQVVNGPRRVQYYKKKYSSSSHGVNTDADALRGLGGVQSTLDSQRLTGATSGLGSVGRHSTYDERRHHEVHESTNRVVGASGRLEDFGERVDGTQQVLQQVPSTSGGDNWHRADSWRTDGGRGVVHEEEGQVVNGPTKVKYYRQNYSSSYSSGDAGAVVPAISEPNLDAELQRLHSKLDSFGREIHQSTVGQSSVSQTVGQTGYVEENVSGTNARPGRVHPSYADEDVLATTYARPQTSHTSYVDENVLTTTNVRPQPVHVQQDTRRHHSTIRHGVVAESVPTTNERYHSTRGDRYQETVSSGRDYSAPSSHIDDLQQTQATQRYHVASRPRTTVRKSETHQVYEETAAPQSQVVLTSASERHVDRTRGQLVQVPIHTAPSHTVSNTDYRGFHSNGEVQGNQLVRTHVRRLTAEEIRQAQILQDQTMSQNLQHQNTYGNADVETVNVLTQQPAAVNRYEEKWSEGYRSHSTVPQQQNVNGVLGSYRAGNSHNSQSSRHESGSHFYEGFRTPTDQLVTGGLSLGTIGQTSGQVGSLTMGTIGQTGADCDQGVTTSEQYQYGSVHRRNFKREAKPEYHDLESVDLSQHSHQVEDLTQQTAGFDDFYRRHSQNQEHRQHDQHSQQTEDLTQQTGDFDGFGQQTSGHLEFGQETQQTEDLTQQTSGFDGLSQQTGKLEFGHQQHQQHVGKLEFGQETQQTEDLTQQTSGFDGLSQQTGNLEFGHQQHQQHVGKLEFGQETQQTEDLTQQASGFDGLSQQAGHLEFGHQQQQQHVGKLEFGQETQQTEDLTQQASSYGHLELGHQHQTGKLEIGQATQQIQQTDDVTNPESLVKLDFNHETENAWVRAHEALGHQRRPSEVQQTEDLTQQTTGHLEFGQQQQSSHSGKRESDHQAQQTEDLTQQTSGHLEFGQHQQHHSGKLEFGQETQQTEDLTQQTGGFDDFTQQTSGNLEFGQQHQTHSGKLEFGQETQQTEDLTQQTGGFDDFTQQTSGNLEFGQHAQQTDDLSQQTSGHGDLGFGHEHHQHSGDHEFGHDHHQHSGNHESGHEHHQHSGNLESGHDHHQHSGNLELDHGHHHHSGDHEFGPHHHQHSGNHEIGQETQKDQPLTQQTIPSHILGSNVQQTTVNLEFGQEHQQHQSGKLEFGQETQQTEDLNQQTGGFDDFTQQTTGNLDFGQQHQQQQTGKLEFGQQHQQHQTGKLEFGQESQQTEDLTQQTGGFDDFTQQTSGNLEFGQQHQQHHSGKLEFGQETQQPEDLTQQTGGFGDLTQQTSGNLEFGQQHQQHQSGKLEFGQETQQTEDLTQQTGGFGDFTQQTSGNLEFGQQHQQHESGKLEFSQETQQTEDLTQQTGGFGDFTQQTSGNLEFGQQHQQHESGKLEFSQETQQTEDLTQQTGGFGDFTQQTSGNLEFGQQHQQHHSGKLEFGQETQQTEDLTQQTGGFGDLTQQSSGSLQFGQQYQHDKHEFGQQTQDMSQQTGGFGDFTQQTSGSLEFGQQTHGHDVTTQQASGFGGIAEQSSANQELGQDRQKTDIFDVSETTTTPRPRKVYQGVKGGRRRKPAPKPTLRPGKRHGMGTDTGRPDEIEEPLNEFDANRYPKNKEEDVPSVLGIHAPEPDNTNWHQNHRSGDLTNSESRRDVREQQVAQNVHRYPSESIPSRQNSPIQQENSEPEFKVEPRIIEAYGGAGAYDADHNDDLFSGAKHNPSATLPPNVEGEEPWFIREKPIDAFNYRTVYAAPAETTTTAMPETTTTAAPSFWSRVGHKLTNTYEKAKEKASSIFGK